MMGLGVFVVLVSLVPLTTARDLRGSPVINKRDSPDPLLVEIFNDPTASSLTKQHLDDTDGTTSGSGLWSSSGDEPKASDDKTTTSSTVNSETVTTSPAGGPASADTATAVELATGQPVVANSESASAQPQPQPEQQTEAQTQAQTQPKVQTEQTAVETKDDSTATDDKNSKKSYIAPASSQTFTDQVEESDNSVRDSIAAPKSFNDGTLYDAAIVKKTDVPRPNDDVTATGKKSIVPMQVAPPQPFLPQPAMNAMQNDQAQVPVQPQPDLTQAAFPQPDMSQAPLAPQSQAAPLTDPAMGAAAQLDASQVQAPQTAGFQMDPNAQAQTNMPVTPSANAYAAPQVDPYTGMPVGGVQAVPIYEGLKANKVKIEEDECDDMFSSCPDMAKNHYCTNYEELMHTQCKKSCGFCVVHDKPASGSGSDASGASGSGLWSEDDDVHYNGPIWRKSQIPAASGESDSGSGKTSDVWSSSASGANMIQGETATAEETNPSTPLIKKDEIAEPPSVASGSGQPPAVPQASQVAAADEFESGSGANLAEDLATGTVSKVSKEPQHAVNKAKYSEIPKPMFAQPRSQVYPHIDLKEIAAAVNAYKSTALRMLGGNHDHRAFVRDGVSMNIIGETCCSGEAIKDAAQEAEDEATKRTNIPMPPATELLEKMGFPMEEPKSEIPDEPEPDAAQLGMLNQEDGQQGAPEEEQQNVAKSEIEEKPKDEESSGEEQKDKKSKIDDPFQYLHNMPKGASMQPIEAYPGASLIPHGHSSPLLLFKSSQSPIYVNARRRHRIPKPKAPVVVPAAPVVPQMPAAPKSELPQPEVNPFAQLEALNGGEPAPAMDDTAAFQQGMEGNNAMSMDDNTGIRGDLENAQDQSPNPEDLSTGSPGGLNIAASFFNAQPRKLNNVPGPSATIGGKEQSAGADTDEEKAASFFDDAVTGRDPDADDQQEADELTGSLTSRFTTSQAPETKGIVPDTTHGGVAPEMTQGSVAPEVEISGKLPKKSKVFKNDGSTINQGATAARAQIKNGASLTSIRAKLPQQAMSSKLPPVIQPLNPAAVAQANDKAANLPSTNSEVATALTSNSGAQTANSLPPLAHGMEPLPEADNAASYLPPLNHGIEASFLPPLNHGKDSSANLPPLIHGNKAEALPPLNHAMEGASSLPPLLKGVEQANTFSGNNNGKNILQNSEISPPLSPNELASNTPVKNQENSLSSFYSSQNSNTNSALSTESDSSSNSADDFTSQRGSIPQKSQVFTASAIALGDDSSDSTLNSLSSPRGSIPQVTPSKPGIQQTQPQNMLADSSNTHDITSSNTAPPGSSSSIIPDASGSTPDVSSSNNVPDVSSSNNVPDVSSSSNVPDLSSSNNVPDVSSSSNVPDMSSSSNVPDVSLSSNVPDVSSSNNVPDVSSSSSIPDGTSTSKAPGVSSSLLTPQVTSSMFSPGTLQTSSPMSGASSPGIYSSSSGNPQTFAPMKGYASSFGSYQTQSNTNGVQPQVPSEEESARKSAFYLSSKTSHKTKDTSTPSDNETAITDKNGDSSKSYRPPMLPPLEHAQSNPEMNFFFSNSANTEGSRYRITADPMSNSFTSQTSNMLPPLNHAGLPPLNHNELPPLRYSAQDDGETPPSPSPLGTNALPPEGEQSMRNYGYDDAYNDASPGEKQKKKGDYWKFRWYPPHYPPEGSQNDKMPPSETKEGSIGKKNLIRPKPDLECGSGWSGAWGDFGTFCYQVKYVKNNWDDARKTCQSAGGDLFSVTNAYEQRFLENFTDTESWLGYRDKTSAGTWSWSDGSKSVYTDWDSSAKDDHGLGRDCVVLDSKEGKWRDAPCTDKNSFLCKKDADDCSNGWKKLTLNSVRGCYRYFEDQKTWDEANQACQNDDGNLASILTDDEQTMVSQVYSQSNMWIGYNDKTSEGDWIWSDQMTSSYTNWDDKSPNNGGVTCAIVTKTGKWHDEPCTTQYSYICKKPSPKSSKDLQNDGVMMHEVQDFITNNTLIPDIDTTMSIFGRKSVAPMYFWTAQKIYNDKIHGSNPIATHGHIKAVDGGIQLNGVDSWLDAGDFYGQCLGDPDLCIKGFSFGIQLNFDDDAESYTDKRYVIDSAGDSRGVSVYIKNNTINYKVVTSTKTWKLSTELITNEWQDIVMTWKKEEGLMLYVNGAFRDSQKEGSTTDPVPNKQARLTVGRKSGNPPYRYTRMYVSSLYAFTRFLAPEDVPYVFTYDDTIVARYMWLLPKLLDGKITGSPDIDVNGPVKAVDGGVYVDGAKAFLKVGDFSSRCIADPTKCPNGLSVSTKLKFNSKVRQYKNRRYILDTGGHEGGTKGIAAYIVNNNLYFTLAMSTAEDTLRWTVRTSIFTVRWQRVVLTWSLDKGLWLYVDRQFRALTKTPKTVPKELVEENSEFIIGRKNLGDDVKPAEFSIGSLALFSRFLDKKAVSKVFGGKKMPYPGLIREVWKDLPGKNILKLKADPYYPNDPSVVEIIENFDAPFDVEKDYGSRVKGYFVAPETGNYTFYLSGSKTSELWLSTGESAKNMTKMISLSDATGHNQWNKFTAQISAFVNLEAGKYYYITALEKGTESTDSLSAGIRLPSGRFMRPVSKEILQWRLPGDPFSGVIREVWQDIPGYKITDLTSNPNFPNNPSSIEVLDKFDAPHNVDDNYGTRLRGFFKAPEDGQYRFFLAADTTGELWLSTDETEGKLKKIVDISGWTDHNEWLKFPEQKSEHIHLKKGRYYYLEVYHKADKLADCASVAVEFPSGHFEGPVKRVHLSWRLPDGKTGPGPSTEEEAIPKPVGLYPLTSSYAGKDASGNNDDGILNNVQLVTGPDDSEGGAYEFKGKADSYIEIPNKNGKLDTKNSITLLANIYPTGSGGPIVNYMTNGWGVHLWQFEENELFVRFVHRNGEFHKPIGSRVLQRNKWNQVGATYDNTTGVAQLWHNGKMVKSRNVGRVKLATQYDLRLGARDGDDRRFAGKISCVQIYSAALDQEQIGNLKKCPVKSSLELQDDATSGSGSGSWDSAADIDDTTGVSLSHEAGKYDKDEEADDLIQGSEFTTGKKCDPSPCENSGKCVKDAKRLDGYRCKCTSDFTGRNCQVSKPDAENPIVKRTKIPRAEKKVGSEKYQEKSAGAQLLESLREEKKEDVLLLFQKLGCYRDDVSRHDIQSKLVIKSVSQENCARACALEEKGFSYFGLQNSDQCYCGHGYGKYGKATESLCDKPCKGNAQENCGGNSTNMVYFFGLGTNYTVKVHTGDRDGAESDSNVYVTLYGDKGDSGFRKLNAKQFARGKDESTTMLLPELGSLKKVRILHDSSGKHPNWFLDKVTVTDENGKVFNFPCKEWLSETQGGGKTERLLHLDTTSQS